LNLVNRVIRLFRAQVRPDSSERIRVGPDHGSQRHTRAHGPGQRGRQAATPARDVDPDLAALYANLEVPYGSDLETVRKARNRLLRKYHPDLHSKDPEKRKIAGELTRRLNGAYEALQQRPESETNRQEN
jgi:DnaJ-class molecular chaperone